MGIAFDRKAIDPICAGIAPAVCSILDPIRASSFHCFPVIETSFPCFVFFYPVESAWEMRATDGNGSGKMRGVQL